MKKRQLFLYALSLSVSAAAFGGVSVFADSDYSSQTITAKVTGIDGSSVDLQVGRKSRMTTAMPLQAPRAQPTAMLRPRRKNRMMPATVWTSLLQAMTL